MIQEKGKRRARRAPALLAAYLALALLAGCTGGAGSSAAEQNSASSSGAAESALSLAPRPTLPIEHSASLTARTTLSGRRSDVAALSR